MHSNIECRNSAFVGSLLQRPVYYASSISKSSRELNELLCKILCNSKVKLKAGGLKFTQVILAQWRPFCGRPRQ
jgi:hypothetical protein